MSGFVVQLEDVHRRYGRVVALEGARLSVGPGEVHALLGGNGAGKSTLLRVLAGLTQPDKGRILLDGRPVQIANPREAWALGVGLVHQHFTLVPRLTVLENLGLGRGGMSLGTRELTARANELMRKTGLHAPLDAAVETLGVGDRQRVEILKVLLKAPKVVILDEPTAVLAPLEVESLLALLRTLAAEGRSIILVAHKLDEVLSVADRVTVLRDGRTVLEAARAEVDAPRLVAAMVGSVGTDEAAEVELEPSAHAARVESTGAGHDVVARLQGVSVRGTRGELALKGVDLEIRRGEIVGVAGVEGNGQAELAQVVAGRRAPDEGIATLPAEPGFVPQDRTHEGLIGDFTITENVALTAHRRPENRRGPLLDWPRMREQAWGLIRKYSLRAPSPETRARALSGGNQQRVVVAREVAANPELLVAENPTRGVDVTAAAFVHRQLKEMHGAGVLLISTDLDEVLRLSDRVLVITRGRLLAVPPDHRTREQVGRLMLAAGDVPGAPAVEPRA